MPEWSIGAVSKTVVLLRVPRVRIPFFPQYTLIIKGLQKLRSILRTMSADFGRFLCGFGMCWSPFLVRFPGGGVCVFSKVVFFSFTTKLGAYNVRNGSPVLPAHSWRRFAPSADVWCLFLEICP
jgi:hypothetical protein